MPAPRPIRFVWPPNLRAGDGADLRADGAPPEGAEQVVPGRDAPDPTEPRAPADATDPSGPAGRAERGLHAAGRAGPWWSIVERELLGVRDLSFERRANAEGFEGDSVLSVCWRCGTTVGPHETDGDGCASCRARRLAWSRFVRVGSYEGLLRKGLLELKFERSRGVGRELGRRLGLEIGRQLDRLGVVPEAARIVPVPMPWGRRMIRGVDHALVVARAAGAASGVRVSRMLRARAGPEQVGRSRRDRLTGLSRRFRRVHAPDPGVKVWIVVDDVRTTGATMSSACKALRAGRPGGQSGRIGVDNVWAAVVGVTPDRDLREG